MIEPVVSEIEDMVLMLLEAKNTRELARERVIIPKNKDGYVLFGGDQGRLLHIEDMYPESAFITQIGGENDRLFSADFRDLIAHPCDILGERAETALIDNETGTVKWTGFKRMKKPPKGVVCVGKADAWYEMHYREFSETGRSAYQKRLAIFAKDGRPLPAKKQSHWVSYDDDAYSGILHASFIEDAMRAETMLATVSDATELKFPVPLETYKDLFIIRDAPLTTSGRRKAILHWVGGHLRNSTNGKSKVKTHTRGVDVFDIGGIKVTLTPNCRRGGIK